VEKTRPIRRKSAVWTPLQDPPEDTCHAWTNGSCRISAGMGWVATEDDGRNGSVIAQELSTLRGLQVAFDAEVAAIWAALKWFQDSQFHHLVVHSDSTSAIASVQHVGARPGQHMAKAQSRPSEKSQRKDARRRSNGSRSLGHPRQREGRRPRGQGGRKARPRPIHVLAFVKLRVSERFRSAKER
jgi:ribonuclease HI